MSQIELQINTYRGIRNSITNANIENKIKPKNMELWFAELKNLTSISGLSNVDLSQCTSIQGCFSGCSVSSLNLRSWNTSNITNMSSVFSQNTALQSVNVST